MNVRHARPSARAPHPAARGGSALIVVLWVVGLLSILVVSFAFDAHVEARIISYYRKRMKAEYLARSGIEIAKMLMEKSAGISPGQEPTEKDAGDPWFGDAQRLTEGMAVQGMKRQLGEGEIELNIVPEPARRDINHLGADDRAKEESMERILEVGGVPEDLWPSLVNSFMDWTDADDTVRQDGAETEDYYATLDPPYQAANGMLDTVDELLLVKGFNRTILYGGVLEGSADGSTNEQVQLSGIADLLTVDGSTDGKININAASPRVLMTLPKVDQIVAGAIVEEREGLAKPVAGKEFQPFRDINDLFARIPELDVRLRNYVSNSSQIYRITSVGRVGGVEKAIWCIAEYTGRDLTVLRWREED